MWPRSKHEPAMPLVETLARLRRLTGGSSSGPGAPDLEVLYSPGHQSADALIERVVYAATNRRAIIVVSADRGIRDLCRNLNALVMEPDNFLASVREADGNTRSTLEFLERGDTLRRVENRLDERDLDQLRKLKEKLDR